MTQIEHLPAGSISRFLYEVREGARREANVVFALIFRDLKNRSEGSGLLSLINIIIEPTIAVIVLSAFWFVLKRQEIQGVHVALFLAVSYVPFNVLRRGITSIPRAVKSTHSFYAFQSVKPIDAILARLTIELVLSLIGEAILLFLLWWFLDLTIKTDHALEAIVLYLLMNVGALGLSLFIGVYGTKYPPIFTAVQMMGRGLLFVSAVIHPASELPAAAQSVIAWNPIAHFEELFRSYLLGTTPFAGVSASYMSFCVLIILFLGFAGYYVNRLNVIKR